MEFLKIFSILVFHQLRVAKYLSFILNLLKLFFTWVFYVRVYLVLAVVMVEILDFLNVDDPIFFNLCFLPLLFNLWNVFLRHDFS